jgi:hypothetical protein
MLLVAVAGLAGVGIGRRLARPAPTAEVATIDRDDELPELRRELALLRAQVAAATRLRPATTPPPAAQGSPVEAVAVADDVPEPPATFFHSYFGELDVARDREAKDLDFAAHLQGKLADGAAGKPAEPRLDEVACSRALCRVSFTARASGPMAVAEVRQVLARADADLAEVSIFAAPDGSGVVAYAARDGFQLPVPTAP